tara:strand:- start:615 stop:839 length:225 start_codon:yes stop_codon:yes gene_type:complete
MSWSGLSTSLHGFRTTGRNGVRETRKFEDEFEVEETRWGGVTKNPEGEAEDGKCWHLIAELGMACRLKTNQAVV